MNTVRQIQENNEHEETPTTCCMVNQQRLQDKISQLEAIV